MWYNNFIVNQRETPAIISDLLANRPVRAGKGAVFISSDTLGIYRYNGAAWDEIRGTGSGEPPIYIFATGTNTVTDSRLIGKSVKLVLRGGIGSGEIVLTGPPVDDQLLFDPVLGSLEAVEDFGNGELLTVIAQ